ncbi:hypothetical protein CY34DRAFT_17938 [Suillus luteus UH-Slu-Lm8-n1]|uniref:Uncharacterized protein n=1 Tax=Suillus luteus UH-Slu-Lm8-n1 TaxID=930992 RepID=A0A0D0AIP8_9AGAM|nr:hypothetical protein CY34DRAFT_17938 [Suillus luteus UH-Slu-Lm8-n1]
MPPFKSSVSILLPADAADSLLQILENSVHVPPALLSLHQLLIDKAHCQGDLVNGVVEDDAKQCNANARAHLQGQLWTPEPTPGLPDTLSLPHTLDVHTLDITNDFLPAPASNTHSPPHTLDVTTQASSDVPSLVGHRRAQCQVEGPNHLDSTRLTKRTCKSTTGTLTGAGQPGELPDPGFDLPNFVNATDDCNRGARLLRLRRQRAAALGNDPFVPEEYEAEEEEEGEGEGECDGEEVAGTHSRRGLWCRRPSNDPKITCSEDLATIIAELASAHCRSSIHNPLNWLQDIANHVQMPLVEDELLISVVVRCQGIASKDVRINFLLMVNYMTLVFKCQSVCLKTGLRLTDIYKKEIKPNASVRAISYRTFAEWHAIGCKFIAIACGGSIYSLVLIAGLGLRVAIASMVGTLHLSLANILRSPPPSK